MFNVTKSAAPPGPFFYNDIAIVTLVRMDFSDKCYLCEEKTPRHLEVEHFYPQAFYPHLIHDWENLLCICEKSNKLRPKVVNTTNENEVLNCCTDNVQAAIKLRYKEAENTLEITANDQLLKTQNTIGLLDKIYNGAGSASFSYVDLRREIARELAKLVQDIKYHDIPVLRHAFEAKIKMRLSRTSCFSAIKRTFIQDKHPAFTDLFD